MADRPLSERLFALSRTDSPTNTFIRDYTDVDLETNILNLATASGLSPSAAKKILLSADPSASAEDILRTAALSAAKFLKSVPGTDLGPEGEEGELSPRHLPLPHDSDDESFAPLSPFRLAPSVLGAARRDESDLPPASSLPPVPLFTHTYEEMPFGRASSIPDDALFPTMVTLPSSMDSLSLHLPMDASSSASPATGHSDPSFAIPAASAATHSSSTPSGTHTTSSMAPSVTPLPSLPSATPSSSISASLPASVAPPPTTVTSPHSSLPPSAPAGTPASAGGSTGILRSSVGHLPPPLYSIPTAAAPAAVRSRSVTPSTVRMPSPAIRGSSMPPGMRTSSIGSHVTFSMASTHSSVPPSVPGSASPSTRTLLPPHLNYSDPNVRDTVDSVLSHMFSSLMSQNPPPNQNPRPNQKPQDLKLPWPFFDPGKEDSSFKEFVNDLNECFDHCNFDDVQKIIQAKSLVSLEFKGHISKFQEVDGRLKNDYDYFCQKFLDNFDRTSPHQKMLEYQNLQHTNQNILKLSLQIRGKFVDAHPGYPEDKRDEALTQKFLLTCKIPEIVEKVKDHCSHFYDDFDRVINEAMKFEVTYNEKKNLQLAKKPSFFVDSVENQEGAEFFNGSFNQPRVTQFSSWDEGLDVIINTLRQFPRLSPFRGRGNSYSVPPRAYPSPIRPMTGPRPVGAPPRGRGQSRGTTRGSSAPPTNRGAPRGSANRGTPIRGRGVPQNAPRGNATPRGGSGTQRGRGNPRGAQRGTSNNPLQARPIATAVRRVNPAPSADKRQIVDYSSSEVDHKVARVHYQSPEEYEYNYSDQVGDEAYETFEGDPQAFFPEEFYPQEEEYYTEETPEDPWSAEFDADDEDGGDIRDLVNGPEVPETV